MSFLQKFTKNADHYSRLIEVHDVRKIFHGRGYPADGRPLLYGATHYNFL